MILSMTGFGRAQHSFRSGQLIAEIRSLNSRSIDVRMKLPYLFREHEMIYRQEIQRLGIRGKFDLSLHLMGEQEEEVIVDTQTFRSLFRQMKDLQQELEPTDSPLFEHIIGLPHIWTTQEQGLKEDEVDIALQTVIDAMSQLNDFRQKEGGAMKKDLLQLAKAILEKLTLISPYEAERKSHIQNRLWQALNDRFQAGEIDETRFQQEVLYYLEKLDIHEEKVRLNQHCTYFLDQLQNESIENGRLLNFISQEMGREINTLGSKANHSSIQHYVVQMKEDLERIKEQIANIL